MSWLPSNDPVLGDPKTCDALELIIVPSERLVIVRLGRSPNWPPEADGVFDLVRDVVAETGSKGKLAGAN